MGSIRWTAVVLLVLAAVLAVLPGVLGFAEVAHGAEGVVESALECCQRGG